MEKKIEEDYKKYKFIAENSPDILLQTTKFGIITYMSRNVESIFGYTLKEVIGKHFKNFVPNSEMPRYLLKMKEMISGKIITSFRTYALHKNGDLIPIELSGKFVVENNKSYFNAIMRNITDIVQTEDELKKSELQRKYILSTIPDLLFIINKDGVFTSYHGNRKALYQPPNVFLNNKLNSILPKPLAEKTFSYIKKALRTNKIQIFNYSLEINNKLNWFEARMIAINNEEVMSIIRDITSLKEQQDQIIKRDNYLKSIINSASEIIFTVNLENEILVWNDTAIRVSGYSSNEIKNKKIDKLKFINNYSEFKTYLLDIVKNKSINKFDLIIKTKFNNIRIWNLSPSIIKNESNEISEVLFICNDVTYEKEIFSNIIFGRGYLFLDGKNDNAYNLFCNSLKNKNKGLIFTRHISEKINEICDKRNIELFQFSSDIKGSFNINDPNSLYKIINRKSKKNSIILLERLDYFFNIYPFKETISNLYKINEIVKNKELLLIICLNPDSLSKEKIIALKEEFYEYLTHKTQEIIIDKDLYSILDFINSRNIGNIIVTYKDIGEKFSISKMTVTKKIDKLLYLELVISSKTGRSKILYLTKKGKNLIESKSKYG